MGGDFAHRWTQTRDAILAMKQLWTTDESEYHGKYYNFPPVISYPKPAHKPHPPVLLGGSSQHVFKRIIDWGDGWVPTIASAEQIRRGRATLNELAAQAGRDPQSIPIFAFGGPGQFRDRGQIEELAQAGANHATLWIKSTSKAEALAEVEEIARLVL